MPWRSKYGEDMVFVGIRIPKSWKEKIESYDSNVSEFIREAIERRLSELDDEFEEKLKLRRKELILELKQINSIFRVKNEQRRQKRVEKIRKQQILEEKVRNFKYLKEDPVKGLEKWRKDLEREYKRLSKTEKELKEEFFKPEYLIKKRLEEIAIEEKVSFEEVEKLFKKAFPDLQELEL